MPVTPSEQEEEYFARQEFERRKKVLIEQESRGTEGERQRILAVAHNRCPKCAAPLVPITYRKVELDKCLSCEGLWFDRGEVDRVLAQKDGFLSGLTRIFA